MGLFSKKSSKVSKFNEYHGHWETRRFTGEYGSLKWKFEVELHTEKPPTIRYQWIEGERNRFTEHLFVDALRFIHGAYGWRYIDVVDKDEYERLAAVDESELVDWKAYESDGLKFSVIRFNPPLFDLGMPMSRG